MERTRSNSSRSGSSSSGNRPPSPPMTRNRRLSLADPGNISHNHGTVWIRQNRNLERQRAYYTNYYFERNRVNNSNTVANNVSNTTTPLTSPFSWNSPNDVTNASTQTNNGNNVSTTTVTTPPMPTMAQRSFVISSLPSTSSNSTTTSNTATDLQLTGDNNTVYTPANTVTTNANTDAILSSAFEDFQNYMRSLTTIIEFRGVDGRRAITSRPLTAFAMTTEPNQTNASGSSNTAENNNIANNLNPHVAQIDHTDAFFFAFSDMPFGLTKQEINRHTISYVYKPRKRKRMKSVSNDTEHSSSPPIDSCSICLDHFSSCSLVRRLPCLHVFHIKCIDKWLKRNKKCPICRIAITINYETLMTSLKSGTSIDQCLSQQETSVRELVTLFQHNLDSNNNSRVGATITNTDGGAANILRNRSMIVTMHLHNEPPGDGRNIPSTSRNNRTVMDSSENANN